MITIILLLLLAAITISSLTSSGLFGAAKNSKIKTEVSQEIEELRLAVTTVQIDTTVATAITTVGYDELYAELTDTNKHPEIQGVEKVSGALPGTAVKVSSKKGVDLKNLFVPNSLADDATAQYAKVTYKSGRKYYIGVGQDNGSVFSEERYDVKVAEVDDTNPGGTNPDNAETIRENEKTSLKEIVRDSKDNGIDIKTELEDKTKHPKIKDVKTITVYQKLLNEYDQIQEVANIKQYDFKNLFMPVSSAAAVQENYYYYARVTFDTYNVYYIFIGGDTANVNDIGKIYEDINNKNTSDLLFVKLSEFNDIITDKVSQMRFQRAPEGEIDEYNDLLNFLEENGYNNDDGYAVVGLNSRGELKLQDNVLNELKIPSKYNGKDVKMVFEFKYDTNLKITNEDDSKDPYTVNYSKIQKVIIPSSVKVVAPFAFFWFNNAEFEKQGAYDYEGVYAFEAPAQLQ